MSLQRALAEDDSAVNDEIVDMGLNNNDDNWIMEFEDDGDGDDIIDSLHGEPQYAGIQSVSLFLSGTNLTHSAGLPGVMGGLEHSVK